MDGDGAAGAQRVLDYRVHQLHVRQEDRDHGYCYVEHGEDLGGEVGG